MSWALWVAGGFALGVIELLLPGFIFLGFAIGAVLTGAFIAFVPGVDWPLALVAWSILSLVAWGVLRAFFRLPGAAGRPKIWKRDINDTP
jgi:membrane protein implicated in regulation of membrane protease activity